MTYGYELISYFFYFGNIQGMFRMKNNSLYVSVNVAFGHSLKSNRESSYSGRKL